MIKAIPFARPSVRMARMIAARTRWRFNNRNVWFQLSSHSSPDALRIRAAWNLALGRLSGNDRRWISGVERERERLLADKSSLVDGSLGTPGPYDENITVDDACQVSKPRSEALLLYGLIRQFTPVNVLELGTNVGISSAYIAAALAANGGYGTVTTLDASGYRQKVARDVHRNLGLKNIQYVTGMFDHTLSSTLDRMENIDFAFVDGNHQFQPTLDYFNAILSKATPHAVFVFDDIHWSEGMNQAWQALCADPRLGMVVDFGTMGLGVRTSGQSERPVVFTFSPLVLPAG